MKIGGRISQRLAELNWKRKDLCDAVPELTPQALYALITRDSARSEWDIRIANALGVSVLWLVYGEEAPGSIKPSGNGAGQVREPAATYLLPEHHAISEVRRLMGGMDELGKGMLLIKARDIAKERASATNKQKSSA